MKQRGVWASARRLYDGADGGQVGLRSTLRHLIGLVWVMHLPRAALCAVSVWVFSTVAAEAAGHAPNGSALARLLLGVLCVQAAIAGVNDYTNRYLDAAGERAGPLVRGLIQPWEALTVPIGLAAVMLVAVGSLGVVPLLLACALLVLGLLCGLYFKGSLVSAALYAVYVPLVPLLAWSVFGRWQPFLPWIVPLGAVAGVGLHVAGSVPDVEREAAIGLRGLPHRLGMRRCEIVACVTIPVVAGGMWVLGAAGAVRTSGPGLAVGTAAGLLASGVAEALYLNRRSGSASLSTAAFTLVAGVVCLAAGWLMAAAATYPP